MISFPCAGCRKALQANASFAGRKVKCNGCGTVQTVPFSPAPANPAPTPPPPYRPPAAIPVAMPFAAAAIAQPARGGAETTVLVARPSLWRNHLVGVAVCYPLAILVPVLVLVLAWRGERTSVLLAWLGVGIPPALLLLKWELDACCSSLTITTQRSILRQGILSRHTGEVRHRDVRAIYVRQGFVQRLLGVGKIEIASSGHGGIEIGLAGLVDPHAIADVIRGYQA